MLQVDPGREFMGSVTQEMEKHKTYIRRGRTEIHRDQAIREFKITTMAMATENVAVQISAIGWLRQIT